MSITGALQNYMHGHDVLPSNTDEAQSHYTYKRKYDISPLDDRSFLDHMIAHTFKDMLFSLKIYY